MEFLNPKTLPPISTFRIMNNDGIIEDESQASLDVKDEQVIEWYKNMVFGA
jgi:hypothetical protein